MYNLISYNLKKELTNYDLFFCLGGLGPTFDDITIDAVSSALNIDYKYNKEATNKILNFLKSRKIEDEKLINLNLRQARYIGSPLMNGAGFAVGSFLKLKKKQ